MQIVCIDLGHHGKEVISELRIRTINEHLLEIAIDSVQLVQFSR